ncbi:S41 family peptidase [Georgenia sp. H159]|uniref:S41 family peptidase n=1 Tax=Georgenia sp. H159 TaxID=3076115 RepID=UPI002D799A6E|nr:S41 family peptidase [Georgenia sp. H159]
MSAYQRYPHIHGDLVTFIADDDVWLAPTAGGRAWRLTTDRAPATQPRFSPDGAHLAYVSNRDGHPEVSVVDLDTGDARRLTWWGAFRTLVLGWTADGRVLAATHAGEANLRHLVVKAVALDGAVERLDLGPASGVAITDGGRVALSTPGSRPPAQWKRYRGGTASRLWLRLDGAWQQLLEDEPAGLVDPMWLGDRLAFVSDRAARFPDRADEQANLWLWDTPGSGEPRQLTHQGPAEGYVRDATTDGIRVVWHSKGRLWLLEDVESEARPLEVTVPVGAPSSFAAKPTENLERILPDHGGDASLVSWRGNAFWLSHREGPARALVADSGVRVREPALLGRTGQAVLVTDADGEDALEIHSLTSASELRRLASGALGRVLHLASDPAGTRVATISHDGAIRLVDVESGQVTVLGTSTDGEAKHPSFSPDGRYLLWSQPTGLEGDLHQLRIADLAGDAAPVALTSGKYHDHSPAFSADGKFVVFLSDRTFDPSYDTHEFGLSFSGSTRPWLIPLSAREPAPFGPSADGWRISKAPEEPKPGSEPALVTCPDLDAEGAEERIVPFGVPSGDYRDLRAAKSGVLWVKKAGETGELGSRRAGVLGEPATDSLEYWSFAERKASTVADKVDSYAVSGDGERVVLRHKDTVTVQAADKKPPEDDDAAVVTVDLARLRFDVDPGAEWRQMFEENARLMRDHFWREDMDGVDWAAVTERWRPVLRSLRTHDDLIDLLWEVNGELNTSHAYAIPATPPGDQERRLGLLGADLVRAADGWRIERILPGESSDPDARSPLRAAGVDAQVGDVVVAVDGVALDGGSGPGPHLVGAADKPVELTLRRGGEDRRVVVVPLASEETLRYQDWVRSRREYVREHSGGRLGYVHVPDMVASGWAQLHRDLRHASRAEGLIVDVRYNRGGHTSQLVLARLVAKVLGWDKGRHYASPIPYPTQAPRGPVVLVANENSGSDGDIIAAAAQEVGLGPVVGTRTWGGVVGIDGRFALVDGTEVTQPRYAFAFNGKGWGVENHGVDPDIEVVHSPADFFAAEDKQLDRAIAEAFGALDGRPAAEAPGLPAPKVWGAM